MLLMDRNSGFSIDCCPHPTPSPRGTSIASVATSIACAARERGSFAELLTRHSEIKKNRAEARFFIPENHSVIVIIIIAVIFVITFAMSVIAVVTVIAMRIIAAAMIVVVIVGINFNVVAVTIPVAFATHIQ